MRHDPTGNPIKTKRHLTYDRGKAMNRMFLFAVLAAIWWAGAYACEPASVPNETNSTETIAEAGQTEVKQLETTSSEPPTPDTSATENQAEPLPEPKPEPKTEPAPEPIPETKPESTPEQPRDTPKVSCPLPGPGQTVGTRLGNYLVNTDLKDCNGKTVKLSDFCGANAIWISFHHGWCPHCRLLRDIMEPIHSSYQGKGLVSIAILVQSSSRTPPDGQACQQWRQDGKHSKVITLYDPTFATRKYWEQNYTALNIFTSSMIISSKFHSDTEADLRKAIQKALGQP